MAAAARAGDPTKHQNKPLGPGLGSHNVQIGSQAAWRATLDFHACPDQDPGPKSHVGGVVMGGSSKVFINGMPAAREGDMIAAPDGTNGISKGFDKVQIAD